MINVRFERDEIKISQDISCDMEFADELLRIIDRIIIDEFIKENPKNMRLCETEQERKIIEKRQFILNMMGSMPCRELDYIHSDETSRHMAQNYEL